MRITSPVSDFNNNLAMNFIKNLLKTPQKIAMMPQKDRKILMAALQRLEKTPNNADSILVYKIIQDTVAHDKPTFIDKVKSQWRSLFPGNVSSRAVAKQVNKTGRDLILKHGLNLWDADKKREAVTFIAQAYRMGDPKAAYALGKMIEQRGVAYDQFKTLPRPKINGKLFSYDPRFYYYAAAKGGVDEAKAALRRFSQSV